MKAIFVLALAMLFLSGCAPSVVSVELNPRPNTVEAFSIDPTWRSNVTGAVVFDGKGQVAGVIPGHGTSGADLASMIVQGGVAVGAATVIGRKLGSLDTDTTINVNP